MSSSTSSQFPKNVHPNFELLHTISNSDGLTVVITKRTDSGQMSLALLKCYAHNGEPRQSSYFKPAQVEDAIDLLKQADAWLQRHMGRR
jgi:predicted deacetylase